MNSDNLTNKIGGITNAPLQLFQPMNFVVFFSFFSPIIIATSITSLSFIFQNFKGLIYLGFLIGCCLIRNLIYMSNGGAPVVNYGNNICTSIQYSKYGNSTFSAFVFAFTITYLSLPMFSNGAPNLWVFISLVVYFAIDILIKLYHNCVPQKIEIVLNIVTGIASAAAIISLMYTGGSGKYLFFNEVSSNKEICYQPKKQNFKCSLYRNGSLVGNI